MFRSSLKLYTNRANLSTFPLKRKRLVWLAGLASISGITGFWYYNRSIPNIELNPEQFTKYRISNKKNIDENHFLLEVTPLKLQKVNLWALLGADKLWSVEIKQPEVMVVRSYTPLPLKMSHNDTIDVLKDGENCQGKLVFYIKQYKNGEVAKWLNSLPEGHILEVRGPFIDYEFPDSKAEPKRSRSFLWESLPSTISEKFRFQPFDISMFTAGTGIVTALQLLLTESPFRGQIILYHSCGSVSELGPLKHLLDILQKHGRIKLHLFDSSAGSDMRDQMKYVRSIIPKPSRYVQNLPYSGLDTKDQVKPVLALVCGPDDYISTVAGIKYDLSQGPIAGLLGEKGWTNSNVYKLS